MSVGRCGICGAPTITGATCNRDWARLETVLDRTADVIPLLDAGPAKGGEAVSRGTARTLPISIPVMEARTAISAALATALVEICPGIPRLIPGDAVRLLRAHRARLRGSYAAPVLLADLEPAVAQAVQAVDTPRGRMTIPGRCPDCGPVTLHPVAGGLECDRCGTKMTIGEARRRA